MADMYEVVANVEDYKEFVPWCTKSTIVARKPGHFKAQLEIGFSPLVERYMSTVTVAKPHLVKVHFPSPASTKWFKATEVWTSNDLCLHNDMDKKYPSSDICL